MKKILIIKNKRIGDVLLASIVANNLKMIYPDAQITFLCYDYAAPVLENNPNIDALIIANNTQLKKVENLMKLGMAIRKQKFDLVVDLYVKLQSQILSIYSGSPERIAFKKKVLPFSYTHQIALLKSGNSPYGKAIDDRVNILRYFDDKIDFDIYPKIFLTPEEIQNAKDIYSKHKVDLTKKTIMLGVLGSDPSKSLPLNYVADLLNFITQNYDVNILFNYIPSQKPLVDQLLKLVTDQSKIYSELLGKNIRAFMILMTQADLLIANEGGAVHIAKALDKPTFTIYSPYVNKEVWATFENEAKHKSVHLKECKPEIFNTLSKKQLKESSQKLYEKFTPDLILPQLEAFLNSQL